MKKKPKSIESRFIDLARLHEVHGGSLSWIVQQEEAAKADKRKQSLYFPEE